jgi:hypothetical protein
MTSPMRSTSSIGTLKFRDLETTQTFYCDRMKEVLEGLRYAAEYTYSSTAWDKDNVERSTMLRMVDIHRYLSTTLMRRKLSTTFPTHPFALSHW